MEQDELRKRYDTQMRLPDFGLGAQQVLGKAKVLIIGAGGLGCPCIQYLAAAGIGTIGVCDGDTVDLSNLHRQILYTVNDVGLKKTEALKSGLQSVNPHIRFIFYDRYLNNQGALDLFPLYDIIIDCTDDINTRLLISDACVLLQKPLVYGAVFQYEGQVAVFNADEKKISLRDLFKDIEHTVVESCNTRGVLGAITGITGTMQALETIKFITDSGALINTLLVCDFRSYSFYKTNISSFTTGTNIPKSISDFLNRNYRQICYNREFVFSELDRNAFLSKIEKGNVQVIDVRSLFELPAISDFGYETIPLPELLQHPEKIDRNKTVLLFCHAGIRSRTALEFLTEECGYTEVYHLKGGLLKWNQHE